MSLKAKVEAIIYAAETPITLDQIVQLVKEFVARVLDGSMTVIADRFDGKTLNSPNDIAAHPDGSIWFTDPGAGAGLSEGHPDVAGGPQNPGGLYDPRLGDSGSHFHQQSGGRNA